MTRWALKAASSRLVAKPPKKNKARSAGRRSKAKQPTLAQQADPLALYQIAVQAPEVDVKFFRDIFFSVYEVEPRTLREDFCGAGAVCAAWVGADIHREAWGVDLHGPTLAWGRQNNLKALTLDARERVHLVEADVRHADVPLVDVVCAQNFSYCVFQTRQELREYFLKAWLGIKERGLFVVDLFGGYESIEDDKEEATEYDDFEYVWEQHRYDPINARGMYKIHFRFPDKSELFEAFTYDWRLWTIPEVREVMIEAGFDRADVYWEDEDPETGEGTGTYSLRGSGDCDPAWNAYIVGVKGG